MRRTRGETVFALFNNAILLLLTIVTLYPILHVLFASISDPNQLMKHSGLLLRPQGFSLAAYRIVLRNKLILSGYMNTIFYVVTGTTINIVFTSLGAYVLSRSGFYWRKPILLFIMLTMFVTGGMIPTFLVVEGLGMINTRWAIILPGAVSTYNMLIMRTGFASVHVSLEESAKIEGADDFTILWRIFMPVCTPIIAVMVLFYGVAHWNAWFGAMIYLRSRNLYPLQLLLREILIHNMLTEMNTNVEYLDLERVGETIKYSTIAVVTLPILMIYPFLQKYFVKGIMIGSVKE